MPDPTRADSLNLLQNSQEISNYYQNPKNNYMQDVSIPLPYNTTEPDYVKNALQASYDDFSRMYNNKQPIGLVQKNDSIKPWILNPSDYRENTGGGPETFKQRDLAQGILNLSAPMSLYNTNIQPQRYNEVYNENTGDRANYFEYDKLAVTPQDMLTDEQIKEKVAKFGPTGTSEAKLRQLGLDSYIKPTTPTRSASSLKRENDRNVLKKELQDAGLYDRAKGMTPREVMKEGSDAAKAWAAYKAQQSNSNQQPTILPNKLNVEQPYTPPSNVQMPATETPTREGYSFKANYSRDGDMNDYYLGNKRITREEYINATGNKPVQYRERKVRAKFYNGGAIPKYGQGGDNLMSGAYGLVEGALDTVSFGLTDSLTDRGYEKLDAIHGFNDNSEAMRSGANAIGSTAGLLTGNVAGTVKGVGQGVQGIAESGVIENQQMNQALNGLGGAAIIGSNFVGMSDVPEVGQAGEKVGGVNNFLQNMGQAMAYGGNVYGQGGPVYEAEGGEVIDGGIPNTLNGGYISPNSSTSGKIVGNSHANGGVKMTGGEKIYSDRLTVDPKFLKELDI